MSEILMDERAGKYDEEITANGKTSHHEVHLSKEFKKSVTIILK